MMTVEQVQTAFDNLHRVAPIATFILSIFAIGGIVVWWLMSRHIKDLKEWINHLREDK